MVHSFPFELLLQVFKHLDSPQDVLSCAAVCSQWRSLIASSDNQLAGGHNPRYCDIYYKLLDSYGPKFNTWLRLNKIDCTLKSTQTKSTNRAQRVHGEIPGSEAVYLLPHSNSDIDDKLDYETLAANNYHNHPTHLVPHVEHTIQDNVCRVTITRENESIANGSLGEIRPTEFVLGNDILIAIESETNHYYGLPSLGFIRSDDTPFCDNLKLINGHIIQTPENSNGSLLVLNEKAEWIPILQFPRVHGRLNNCRVSPYHVLLTFTRFDALVYQYLVVYNLVKNTVQTHLKMASYTNGDAFGMWRIGCNDDVVYEKSKTIGAIPAALLAAQ